jgi:hypothetical protein
MGLRFARTGRLFFRRRTQFGVDWQFKEVAAQNPIGKKQHL